jgi:predicted alpha-1,2-mannosidase
MTFTHAFAERIEAANAHGFARHEGVDLQFARLQYEYVGMPRDFTVGGDAVFAKRVRVWPGFNSVLIPVRRRDPEKNGLLRLAVPMNGTGRRDLLFRPAAAPRCIPADVESESVSKTLEYAYDDWCIARVAEALGREDDAARYDERARHYRTLFDPDLGFMRGRNLDGSWRSPFNPRYSTLKQHEYTEGNAWQYSWYVPHDVPGLIALHGGVRPFAAKLDSLFEQSSDLEGTGATGDVTGLIGLYAHGNEPSHHIAYLYNHAGQAWKTQAFVRRIMREMYSDRRDGLSGNEDCGQMSAWYVLSAMGFYPLNPCGGVYEIGSPVLHRAEIMLEGGRSFIVAVENNSRENVYVQSAVLNGTALTAPRIRHEDVMRGGQLTLRMGPQPSKLWNEGY